MGRNVVNQDDIKFFIDRRSEVAGNDENCVKWLNSNFRNFVLNEFSNVSPYNVKKKDPAWIHTAVMRGDVLIKVRLDNKTKQQVDLICQYIKAHTFADVTRIPVQAMHQLTKEWKEEVELQKKLKKGTELLGKFSDQTKAVTLTTGPAIRDEAVRQKNCIADYVRKIQQGRYMLVSLRDDKNKSIASVGFAVRGEGLDRRVIFDQVRETCNKDLSKKYIPHVKSICERVNARDVPTWVKKGRNTHHLESIDDSNPLISAILRDTNPVTFID